MSMSLLQSQSKHLSLNGKAIEIAIHRLAMATDTILLLHEALGSVSYWRDFPQKLAMATGCNVLLYSRPGHGNSEGPLEKRNQEHYLRQVEEVIPQLLEHYSIERPILYGHSEGAGIAILYAALSNLAKALILESPFVIPAKSASLHIEKMAAEYHGSKLQEKLARYHQQPDTVFHAWVGWAINVDEDNFSLHKLLAKISCPVLVLQGANDSFGTTVHLEALQKAIPGLQNETFAQTGHLPHREQTEHLLRRVAQFLSGLHHPAHRQESPTLSSFIEEQP